MHSVYVIVIKQHRQRVVTSQWQGWQYCTLPLYGIDSAAGMCGCGRGLGGHGLRLGFFRIVALALALALTLVALLTSLHWLLGSDSSDNTVTVWHWQCSGNVWLRGHGLGVTTLALTLVALLTSPTCDCTTACWLLVIAASTGRHWHLGRTQTDRPRNPANVTQALM